MCYFLLFTVGTHSAGKSWVHLDQHTMPRQPRIMHV